MARIKTVVQQPIPAAVASYDYFDIATAVGYKSFYLAGAYDSTGSSRFLTTNPNIASDYRVGFIGNGADLDFDIEFNKPLIIADVDAIISYMIIANGSNSDTFTAVFTVKHVDKNGTETDLGTVTITDSDGDPVQYRMHTAKIPLSRKKISIGEKLRLNVTLTTAASWVIYTDPAGAITKTLSNTGTGTSRAILDIPIKVDV